MKKILLATLEFPPTIGGIASYVQQFAGALDPVDVIVYAPQQRGDREFDATQKYSVIRKNPLTLAIFWPRWIRAAFQFISIIKKQKIEVVLINHILPLGYAAWFAKKRKHIPYIIISHGTDIIYASRSKWKRKWVRKIVQDAEQVVFNSESLRRRFLERFPEFESKCTVMYPWPDVQFSLPPAPEKMETLRRTLALQGKKVILSVGRLDEGKGFPHMIRAFESILEREPHAVWIIVGDGPKREELLEQIQIRSLQNVTRYIGAVSHDELAIYYYLADAFVLLTHPDNGREEGLGLVFLEAAAAGLPIIAGKSGGVSEAVIDGETGRVLDVFHEANKIVDAVCEILLHEDTAKKYGIAGKKRIEQIFNSKTQLEKLKPWVG